MRWLTVVMALALAAGCVWLLFGSRDVPSRVELGENQDDPTRKPWMSLKSGTLTVRVRAPDGSAPAFAQVGYDTTREPRLYYTDAQGLKTLGDVPLGDLTVVVQAPGFNTERRRTRIEAGVTSV